MTPHTNQTALIAALVDLRLGVEMDRHNLVDAEVKLAALDAAIAMFQAGAGHNSTTPMSPTSGDIAVPSVILAGSILAGIAHSLANQPGATIDADIAVDLDSARLFWERAARAAQKEKNDA